MATVATRASRSDLVLAPHLWFHVPEGCRRFAVIILIANILPRARHFSQKSAFFTLIPFTRFDQVRPPMVCDAWSAALVGGCGSVLEDDLFVVWPDVLLQLCLGKCMWMVCCCHASFNSVPSFY